MMPGASSLRKAFSLNTVIIGGMELWLNTVQFNLVLSCFKLASLSFTVTRHVVCQCEVLVVCPLEAYALSLDVLIRQINLAQRWRAWLLYATVVDYLICLIRTNGIGYISRTYTGCRVWEWIPTAQFSINFTDSDWNKPFHCDGLSSVNVVVTAEDGLKSSNSSYGQQTRWSCICFSVFCLL